MKNCYIFKDILQALIDADVLKLHLEQKKVTTNLTSLQFGKELPSVPAGLFPIPKGELRVINIDPHNKKEKGLVLVPTPRGKIMCGFTPILSKANNGQLLYTINLNARLKHPLAMWWLS